ncbi:WD40-repeat-containing domain protein [Gaertneriomyces semiglobifer]|nr:WD40-repeat-containing domain protein [Gaertneriomyces semiglobifer]
MAIDRVSSLKGHTAPVVCLALKSSGSTEADHLASGAEDATVRLWDIQSTKCIRGIKSFSSDDDITSLCFSGENLLYASAGRHVYLFDTRVPDLIITQGRKIGATADDEINQVAIHENGNFVARADDSGNVTVIDVRTNKPFKRLRSVHESLATCVRFNPRKPWELWSGGMDSTVIHWDFSKGTVLQAYDMRLDREDQPQVVNPPFVHDLDISHDGRTLAAGLGDGSILVMRNDSQGRKDKGTWSQTRMDGSHSWAVTAVAFPLSRGDSATGTTVVSGGMEGQLRVWDVQGGTTCSLGIVDTGRKVNCLSAQHTTGGPMTAFVGGTLAQSSTSLAVGAIDIFQVQKD